MCKRRQEDSKNSSHVLTETWGLLSLEVYLKDLSSLAVLNVYVKVFLLPCLNCYWIFQQSNVVFQYSLLSCDFLPIQHITFTSGTVMNRAWNSFKIMLYKKMCFFLHLLYMRFNVFENLQAESETYLICLHFITLIYVLGNNK